MSNLINATSVMIHVLHVQVLYQPNVKVVKMDFICLFLIINNVLQYV